MTTKIEPMESYGAIPRTIRNYNRRIVLNAVREKKEFSIAEIATEVMLSRQSVMKAVNYFIEKKIIISLGKGSSTETGGKKPEMYALSPVQKILVILQRTDELHVSLMDLSANIMDIISIKINKDLTDEGFKAAIIEGKMKILEHNPLVGSQIYGVAMAVGGLVELKNQSLHRSMYFSNLSVGLPVHDILHEIFPEVSCVIVDNIGRMAGHSVLSDHSVIEKNDRIFTLYMDRAITGSFFVNGKIQDGTVQMMIEVGHMIMDPYDKEKCTCGNYGCAEQLISIKRVRRDIEKLLEQYPDSLLGGKTSVHTINYSDIFEGCKKGDPVCVIEVERLAQITGRMLRNIFLACNPGAVVFIGNFADADHHFDDILRRTLRNDWVYSLRGETFEIFYDQRDLIMLETLGSAQAVIKAFYNDDDLYGNEEGGK
ncbi:ROK family transcriptional regulator [Lacrimispora sp.]|uniref:ROK family transcriptional regulator n=1 Tax=Lacrimispora sp. TaxID=2719234 RepID=UPI0028AF76F6|nr:ROK family transcriptional regulator [Lacrimispora sp.]